MRLLLYFVGFYLLFWPSQEPLPTEPAAVSAGIVTIDTFSVETLVQDIFVGGTCNTITNIEAIGNENGIGYFENGQESIGMSNGIIISTGPVANAQGPNQATDRSGDFQDNNGDPDLNLLATGPVKDAVGIEFDFTPLDSIVTFRYVFASEEYCEFVGSIYNDVFGFFIQGPGINGGFSNNAENVALIPGSNDFVSINSINFNDNQAYYVHNELIDDVEACELDIPMGNFLTQIEYDGFTQELVAVLRLQPCETYHIRLVVSDVGDNFYDSAVFLEAESFNLGGEVDITAATGRLPSAPAIEGCDDAFFVFERQQGSSSGFPLTVNYRVSDESTAQSGIDFEPLPGSITIPVGETEVALPIRLINDGLAEALEDIILELDIPCACFTDSARMFIDDGPPLLVGLPDVAICENGSNTIAPTVEGGIPPYTFQWPDGSTDSLWEVTANSPTLVGVSVFDACGNTTNDNAQVLIVSPPEASISGSVTICEGDTAFLPLTLAGTPPWEVSYSIDGEPQPPLVGIAGPSPALPASRPGTYELTAVRDAGCEGDADGQADVLVLAITVEAQVEDITCFGDANGSIEVALGGGTPPFDYRWLETVQTPGLFLTGLAAGAYQLSVTDAAGCSKITSFEVSSPEPIEAISLDCALWESGQLALEANGGTPPYLYSINGQDFHGPSLFESLEAGQEYFLSVQDAAGCLFEQMLIMPSAIRPMLTLPEEVELKLGKPYQANPQLNIPENLIAGLRWAPSEGLSCLDCLYPELLPTNDVTYTLRIVDIYGCSDEASMKVRVKEAAGVYIPTAFSPNGDEVNDHFVVFANTFQVEMVEKMAVFDRWGGLLYRRENFQPNRESLGWDGTARGQLMDPGVYTYYVQVKLFNGKSRIFSGHVLLVR